MPVQRTAQRCECLEAEVDLVRARWPEASLGLGGDIGGGRSRGREFKLDGGGLGATRARLWSLPARHSGKPRLCRRRQRCGGRLRHGRRGQRLGVIPAALPRRQFTLPPSHPSGGDGHARWKGPSLLHAPGGRSADADQILHPLPRKQPIVRPPAVYHHAVDTETHGVLSRVEARSQDPRRKPVSCASAQPRSTPRG